MKKIKLLGICTSARGKESNTYYLMKLAFDNLKDKNVEKEIIIASELNLLPCDHHYSINAKMCVHPCLITQVDKNDEMVKIYDGILNSDITIFSTPIYWGNHSQLMQLIIERLNSLENQNSVHKKALIKNKIAGMMILGHEDGYQHVAGNLMNFLTMLGMIFPPQAYASWVGESNEDTTIDRKKIEEDEEIQEIFIDLVQNTVNFARKILVCSGCGHEFDYEHISKKITQKWNGIKKVEKDIIINELTMKPLDNEENLAKCICGRCPLYTDCNRNRMEGLFCARKKAECEMDKRKMCICGSCPVFSENNLAGGYFCINELAG